MKKTIIFDFDGVIVDSSDIAFETAKMNRPNLTIESYRNKFNENIGKAVYAEPEIDPKFDFQGEFSKKMQTLSLSPAKKKVLQNLSERFDFYIISSTNSQTIKNFCEANGILNYFGDILGFDVDSSKVKKFQMIFKKYNLNPKELVFVTDTIGDIKEAREVGIENIIAVADGYQDRELLKAVQPTHLLDSIVDLEDFV